MTAAVVLAAGRGRRLGGVAKALLEIDGEAFLDRIARRCHDAGVSDVVVVVGEPYREAVAKRASELGLVVIENPEPERGMASSVAVGFGFALETWAAAAALLWPVDHPRVSSETVGELCRRSHSERVAVPTYRGRGGHPVLVGRELWEQLAACADFEAGARTVFRHNRELVTRFEVVDSGVVSDVDRPEDLAPEAATDIR